MLSVIYTETKLGELEVTWNCASALWQNWTQYFVIQS